MDPIVLVVLIFVFIIGIWIVSVFMRRNKERSILEELNQLPEPERTARLAERDKKKSWGCLNGYLLLVMLANLAVAVLTIIYAGTLSTSSSGYLFVLFSAGLNVLAAVFAGVIYWGHKKWAAYGIFAIIGLSLLINLATGNTRGALQNLLPIVILWAGLRPVWNQME
jgi:hypothetical protein